jgi:hypothetical protein
MTSAAPEAQFFLRFFFVLKRCRKSLSSPQLRRSDAKVPSAEQHEDITWKTWRNVRHRPSIHVTVAARLTL